MKRQAIVCEGDGRHARLRRGELCVDCDLASGRYAIALGTTCTLEANGAAFTIDGATIPTSAALPHRWRIEEIKDALGRGKRLTIEPDPAARPPAWSLAFSLYDELDAITIGAAIENTGTDEIELREIRPIDEGRLCCGRTIKTSRLLTHTWADAQPDGAVRRVQKGLASDSHVLFILADTGSGAAVACGALAPMRSVAGFHVELDAEKPPTYRLRARQATPTGCAQTAGMTLAPGAAFAPEHIILIADSDGCAAYEAYAGCVGRTAGITRRDVPCGWSSWPYYQSNVSEAEVVRNVEFLAAALRPYGLETITVDAGWQKRGHTSGGPWKAGEHFPHGIEWLSQQIRRHGFRPGAWIRPFEIDGLRLDPSSAFTHTTLRNAVRQLGDKAGFDALKIDYVHDDAFARDDSFLPDDGSITALEAVDRTLAALREGAGPERFLAGRRITLGAGLGVVDSVRSGDDLSAKSWRLIKEHGVKPVAARYALHGRWWINDPGPAVVRPPLTLGQARAWASLCALAGGMVTAGDRMYVLPAERLDVLKHVMPAYGRCARPLDLFEHDPPNVWVLPVEAAGARWHVVGLFNWDTTPREIKETQARTVEQNLHRLRANDAIERRRRARAKLEEIASTNRLIREENARLDQVMNGHALGGPRLDLLEPLRPMRASARFKNIVLHFDQLGLEPAQGYLVYDFWDDRFLGLHGERLKVLVRLADCVVLAVHPATGVPQLLSTSRHVTQGGVELQDLVWDAAANELSGTSLLVENDPYVATIYVPHEFEFIGADADIAGVQTRHHTPSTVRLMLTSLTSKPVRWKLKFNRTGGTRR